MQHTEPQMAKSPSSNTRFIPLSEFFRQMGGVKRTAGYDLIARHKVQIVRVGSRSMIHTSEVDRVGAELLKAAADPMPVKGGRDLAALSVEARQTRKSKSTN